MNAYNVGAIDRADAVFLIAAPELPSIRNLVRYLEHLKRFNCPKEKTRVVINRYDKRSAIREDQIEKTIRMPISFLVPNSYAEVINAINTGTPISINAKTELGRDIPAMGRHPGREAGTVRLPSKNRSGGLGYWACKLFREEGRWHNLSATRPERTSMLEAEQLGQEET